MSGWLAALGFWVCVAAFALASHASAEPSLASLLRKPPPARDPTQELSQLLSALEQRPFANSSQVRGALAEVTRDLALLKSMYAQAAPESRLRRQEQIVWAGLSWVDRLEARAALANHAAAMRALAERSEAEAELGSRPGP